MARTMKMSLNAWHKIDDNLDYEYWDDIISKREFLSTLPLFRKEYGKDVEKVMADK